jgi:hypothetical protein
MPFSKGKFGGGDEPDIGEIPTRPPSWGRAAARSATGIAALPMGNGLYP